MSGLQLTVGDAAAARSELPERGVEVSEASSSFFADPDGNRWAVQQIPDRT